MSDAELPHSLPGGVREDDSALGLDALEGLRARIEKHVDETQGAWARKPAWQRAWPVALALLAAAGWVTTILRGGGAVGVAAALAIAASAAAFIAVARAPRHPRWSDRAAIIALAGGAVALAAEIGLSATAPPVAGNDVMCIRAIITGSVLPVACLALYLRLARAPARMFHVAAIAGAAFLASAAAVWAHCPGTALSHVLVAHTGVPLAVAVVIALAMRPLLRGTRL